MADIQSMLAATAPKNRPTPLSAWRLAASLACISAAAQAGGITAPTTAPTTAAAIAPQAAQQAHAKGSCGSLGPGTGLVGGKGWIVSMLPGKHELRVRGGGEVLLTVAKLKTMDFDPGRPYYITVEGAPPGAALEWKTPFTGWAPVATTFLYPPSGPTAPKPATVR